MLPMARPGVVGRAMSAPSAMPGAKTCTPPTTTLSSAAASSATMSGAAKLASSPLPVRAAQATASPAPSSTVPKGMMRWPIGASEIV
jgi:hypothetical protein